MSNRTMKVVATTAVAVAAVLLLAFEIGRVVYTEHRFRRVCLSHVWEAEESARTSDAARNLLIAAHEVDALGLRGSAHLFHRDEFTSVRTWKMRIIDAIAKLSRSEFMGMDEIQIVRNVASEKPDLITYAPFALEYASRCCSPQL